MWQPSQKKELKSADSEHHLVVSSGNFLIKLVFRSMTHGLSEQHFTSYEDTKNWIDNWIILKDEAFFQRDIRMLPERWEKVIASDGQYFQ